MLEIAAVLVACAALLAVAVIAEVQLSRIEARARARELHPSGSRCPDCRSAIVDWDAHRSLFHQVRVAAPEDSW